LSTTDIVQNSFLVLNSSSLKERQLNVERFICIYTIMLSLAGVPAFYIHSLFGSHNDYDLYNSTKQNRSLNRGKIEYTDIQSLNGNTKNKAIFNELKKLIQIRKKQTAFYPNAVQFTLHLGNKLYGIWRQSLDKKQSIFCITNLTDTVTNISLLDINLAGFDNWHDLLSDIKVDDATKEIELAPYQTLWLTNFVN